MLALAAYLAVTVLAYFAFGMLTIVVFWAVIGALFAVVQTVTVWPGGWRARLLAAPLLIELGYAVFLETIWVKSIIDIALGRSKHWNAAVVTGTISMRVLATSSLGTSPWFVLLVLFVGFNTIVYAALAFTKLWPRRRR